MRRRLAGTAPDVASFTAMLSSLQVEGRSEEMTSVLQEMAARGIKESERTRAVLDQSDERLSKMRTSKLKMLLSSDDVVVRQAGQDLFATFLARGVADTFQVNTFMMETCHNSEQMRSVMDRAEVAGVAPDVVSFTAML